MVVNGYDLDGRKYNEARGQSMSVTAPPDDATWHHYEVNIGLGNDSTLTPTARQTRENFIESRLEWLDQFEMEETEEGSWRYWRWFGYDDMSGRVLRWWERRSIDAPVPRTPGLWPYDD